MSLFAKAGAPPSKHPSLASVSSFFPGRKLLPGPGLRPPYAGRHDGTRLAPSEDEAGPTPFRITAPEKVSDGTSPRLCEREGWLTRTRRTTVSAACKFGFNPCVLK